MCTDHKPLEWLATVSDAHGRRGRWVGMLQDFSFKIVHRPGLRHTNVDALSRNTVGSTTADDDFSEEIQDMGGVFQLTHRKEKESFPLFRLAKRQNGSISGERIGSWYNIVLVVLGLTTTCMATTISCM
jgi:hypothetical protein